MSASLAEVPYAEAEGGVADVYDKLMRWSGSGSPALIFRHLATFPGLLEWCWELVGPELEDGSLLPALLHVVDTTDGFAMAPLAPALWSDCGIDDDDRALIATMLTSYDRMNTVNYGLISAIRDVLASGHAVSEAPAPPPTAAANPPAPAPRMPAPADIDAMPADVRHAVLKLAAGVPDTDARVVPTLYRHLALWPPLLLAVSEPLQHEMDEGTVHAATERLRRNLDPLVGNVTERATRRMARPAPVADPDKLVATLDVFHVVIPQLIVVGRAINVALPS